MSGVSSSRSTGKLIAFGVLAVPLILLGIWVWEATPESGVARSGRAGDRTEDAKGDQPCLNAM